MRVAKHVCSLIYALATTAFLTDDIFSAGEALLQWHALRVDKSASSAATLEN